jgi:hypothetical protein
VEGIKRKKERSKERKKERDSQLAGAASPCSQLFLVSEQTGKLAAAA